MASTVWPVHSPFAREHYGHGKEDGRTEGKARARLVEALELDSGETERLISLDITLTHGTIHNLCPDLG